MTEHPRTRAEDRFDADREMADGTLGIFTLIAIGVLVMMAAGFAIGVWVGASYF